MRIQVSAFLIACVAAFAGTAMADSPYGSFGSRESGVWYGPTHLQPWRGDLYGGGRAPGWYRVCSYQRGPASPYGAIAQAVEEGVANVETGEVKATCSTGYWYGRTGGWYYPGFGQPLDPRFGWPQIGDPGDPGGLPMLEFGR